jgi:ParB family chromosome partitioning protein
MSAKRRSLGKGLDALLAGSSAAAAGREAAKGEQAHGAEESTGQGAITEGGGLREIPVDRIQRGRYQPRRDFDPEALEELASSIRVQGLMQPIVLRSIGEARYEIIAGERRWRAAQLAGLDAVPALLREVDDESAIAMALIENIQREDLNPMEEATALSRLQSEFQLTQQQIADAVGKSRSAVANLLRLMSLEPEVRLLLERGDLDMGHARCLLGLPAGQQLSAAKQVVARELSVRQTEALVRHLVAEKQPRPAAVQDPDIRRLQDELSGKLGTRVQIQHRAGGKGRVVLDYGSLDELDGILSHIH